MREKIDFAMIGWQLNYSRNRVLLNHTQLKFRSFEIPEIGLLKRSLKIIRLIWQVIFTVHTKIIFIPAFNQVNSPLILIIFRLLGKKIVTDMLISDYDTLVNDRKLAKKKSLRAIRFYLNDWLCLKLSHVVICDTEHHKAFFKQFFGGADGKLAVIPVGAEDIFKPVPNAAKGPTFNILFYGGFSPLHGIEHIIEAANLLKEHEDIRFTLIGSGQTRDDMIKLALKYNLENIDFVSHRAYEKLPNEIAEADIGLGIFGASEKVKRVIPNKVFQLAACGKPIITLRTPAIEAMFENGKNIVLVDEEENMSQKIADNILKLKENPYLRESMAKSVVELIEQGNSHNDISSCFEKILADASA
ncbi:glycosyltransferase [Paenibacillus sp. MMS18-CY102]|uniref:glycosyltransferase n=1 Tax=Paenibacillus sp. MMS18-CY102 TaxID=2682849 RepID=UPI00136607FE|nr:glycosyltransferase [Paenibacillus sp. MMS18-CY102]MWC30428.1 glycosyltransferase [Paenibacillus sp. MMS18-CY102]